MSRVIPLALLLGAAFVGCGTRGGDAPHTGGADPKSAGGGKPAGAPPPPTPERLRDYVFTLGGKTVGGSDPGDPPNGVLGPNFEFSNTITDDDVLALRDPGFSFGLKLTSPRLTDAAVVKCGKLPSLMYLSVGNAPALTAAGVGGLARLKHLCVLELRDLPADDAWLAALKPLAGLRALDLSGCARVTDAGLGHLSGMPHLRELRLHGTKVTGSGLGALANAKGLARVVLPEQTDAALAALAKIGKLHALEEALTAAEGRPATAADVTTFVVRGPVTDAGLKAVSAFPNLTRLSLRGDRVTTASLPFLQTLRKLKHLELGFSITPEQRATLTRALPGCEIR